MEKKFADALQKYKQLLMLRFGERVDRIIAFGSCVDPLLRKKWGYDNILDCLVVLTGNVLRDGDAVGISKIADRISKESGFLKVQLAPLVMSEKEFENETRVASVFKNMVGSGVVLYDKSAPEVVAPESDRESAESSLSL